MATTRVGPIVVLGSVNMDLIGTVDRFPEPGETVLGGEFRTAQGGKGANQAIAAARAGGSVAFVGAVGNDDFGRALAGELTEAGVDVASLRNAGGRSGVALITVSADAENIIVVLPGANATVTSLTPADRDIIAGAALLVCQLEISLSAVAEGVQTAREAGVPVLLNPSPARALPPELLECVTVAVVNRGEAELLGASALAGIPHLITTLGAAGAEYRGPDGSVATVASPRVRAVDTTGAGDAFTGALAVSWTQGLEPIAAVRRACTAGALAATRSGAGRSAPTAVEIDAALEEPATQ